MIPTRLAADPLPDEAALLFGAVARPVEVAWEVAGNPAPRLLQVDAGSAERLPGVVRVVARESFVGVVARTPVAARYAAGALKLQWAPLPRGNATVDPSPVVGAQGAASVLYRWPLRPKASAARVVAQLRRSPEGARLHVWAPLEDFGNLPRALGALLGLDPAAVVMMGTGGDPVADYLVACAVADAALLAQAVDGPVAVDCHPEDAFPGAYWHTTAVSSLPAHGDTAERLAVSAPLGLPQAPPLALVLTGTPYSHRLAASSPPALPYGAQVHAQAAPGAVPLGHADHALHEALVFALESQLDENARAAGQDPVQARLQQLDERGAALVRRVAERAGWSQPRPRLREDGLAAGRGFAYAQLFADSGGAQAVPGWSAWAVDVVVDERTGDVRVERVAMGQDSGMSGADGADLPRLQAEGEAYARRLLGGKAFDDWPAGPMGQAVATDGGLALPQALPVPEARAALQPVLQVHPAAMLPAAAAIANAIFDATGVRMREPPFTGEALLGALRERGAAADRQRSRQRTRSAFAALGAMVVGASAAIFAGGLGTRAIAPTVPPAANLYSVETIERGRLVAAAGDCVACHTAPGGVPNAGGLALPTPFGTIYSTNITPDAETGIGAWSYAAFERAMRHGISRDGHRLYPAFPYTAFARLSDGDMQALYAYLMAQAPVAQRAPETRLDFPFSARPLLALWNAAFHDASSFRPDPARSAQWNRGAYLVNGIGHCGACHTPRNALGAERGATAFLSGGEAEGWRAPALGKHSGAPIPWTEEALYEYLRFGSSAEHGPAGGPMRAVVQGLSQLAESDVRAMAHYLAHLPDGAAAPEQNQVEAAARRLQQRSDALSPVLNGPGARLYEGACAVCHEPGLGGLVPEAKLPLAFNTNLHDARPDNLIQVLLHGIEPAQGTLYGSMPAYADTFDDRQIADLVRYLRARFAPGQPPWPKLESDVARVRAQQAH